MAWRPRETAGVFHSPADAEEMCPGEKSAGMEENDRIRPWFMGKPGVTNGCLCVIINFVFKNCPFSAGKQRGKFYE